MDQTVIVAGIGCRSGVTPGQVLSALETALRASAAPGLRLTQVAIPAARSAERAIVAAAASRGLQVVLVSQQDLEGADARTLTRSRASMRALNVHSVAEAAALAAAGPTAALLAPRVVVGPVTCALATVQRQLK